jgi:hypothetical protein
LRARRLPASAGGAGHEARPLPYFLALAVILTARQATTIDKPLSAEAWRTFGIEGVTGL